MLCPLQPPATLYKHTKSAPRFSSENREELCFLIVWAVLILIEPALGYAPLPAIPAHHGESYLRRDISSYDGLRKPTRYGGLGDLSCSTSKPLRIFSYRYSRLCDKNLNNTPQHP